MRDKHVTWRLPSTRVALQGLAWLASIDFNALTQIWTVIAKFQETNGAEYESLGGNASMSVGQGSVHAHRGKRIDPGRGFVNFPTESLASQEDSPSPLSVL